MKSARNINSLICEMTLDEKLAQIGSYYIYDLQTKGELDAVKIESKLANGIGQITRVAGASTLNPAKAAQVANRLQKFLVESTRLGIPAIMHEECCSGAMISGGSMYPQMLGLAGTFEPELAEEMTTAIRKQLKAIGAHQGLAPVLDVARDARWGRVEETFGEDPMLVSHFGVAYIKGLQGKTLKDGIMATGKHFIGHSLSQGGLNCGPVHMGMRDVFDIYMGPFQAAIRDANIATIMNSYPELDGEVVAASRRILTELLRDQLGFDGIVVSDYEAVIMLNNYHFVAETLAEAGKLALEAGIDVELPTTVCYGEPLKRALEAGDLKMETVDTAVKRHLQKKFELGLFEDPFVDEGHVLEVFETAENRSLARKIAEKSMVLLKNDGLLPLKTGKKKIAVIGPNADHGRGQLGDYSYAAVTELVSLQAPEDSMFAHKDVDDQKKHEVKIVTVLDGIRECAAGCEVLYAKGCDNQSKDRSGFAEAVRTAEKADVVILVLGDYCGLTPICTTGETRDSMTLALPGVQQELAEAVLAAGKPSVAVLMNGKPMAIPWLAEHADAILEAWIPGEEGGHAVADVLFGKVNPGGKLPMTFPRGVGQVPVFYNYKPSGQRSNWYVDYVEDKVTPLYPFGHGLSYTEFEYSDLSIDLPKAISGERVEISCRVKNKGAVAGDEVVQLYTRDVYASLPRPVKELRGYERIHLKPGESKKLTFQLAVNQLAFYDIDLKLAVEPGKILVMIGSSSEDIRLKGEFEIDGKKTIIEERVFVCPVVVD